MAHNNPTIMEEDEATDDDEEFRHVVCGNRDVDTPLALIMDTHKFEHMSRIAVFGSVIAANSPVSSSNAGNLF